jgi:hypothetical protein
MFVPPASGNQTFIVIVLDSVEDLFPFALVFHVFACNFENCSFYPFLTLESH